MPKYRYGKKTRPIDFETFKKIMETKKFKKSSHKSFLAFLYRFGVRRSEALERVKEDFTFEDGVVVINAPEKKGGSRTHLRARDDLPFMDLIIAQVEKTPKGQRVWPFSDSTAWRIVKRALGKEFYPHYLRVGRETRESTEIARARAIEVL